jgi:putative aldouronate transport system substrate-binding protein
MVRLQTISDDPEIIPNRRADMKNIYSRLIILFLMLSMPVFFTTGCSTENSKSIIVNPSGEDTEITTGVKSVHGVDISKKVELDLWMLGDPPKDLLQINNEVNKLTERDLNCTIKFNMLSWSDYMQKYNLLLSSGQPMDLVFTSDWLNYNQFAKKGAFMKLDDLLPVYAPDLYKFVPQDYWDAVKVSNSIYTIPAVWKEYASPGFAYRADLMKKYNLPEPNSLQNIETYLKGIKNNEPSAVLTNEQATDNGFGPIFSAYEVLNIKYTWIDSNMPYGLTGDYDKPSELRMYWGSPDFTEDMKMFKRWSDEGFWSRSALSNRDSIHDPFAAGKTIAVISGENPTKFNDSYIKIKTIYPEWELGYYPYVQSTGLAKPVHPIHNGMALPRSSQNPERALMFYEKLVLDKAYNYLTEYGIEGKNYTIEDGRYYKMLGDSRTNGFQREALNGWAWRNPQIQLFDKSFDKVLDLFKKFSSYSKPDIFFGFVEDYTPYQAERAALYQIQSQYLVPLEAGLVPDVDSAIKLFMEKAKAAGLDKIQTDYIRQWKQYCKEKGLK